MKNDKLYNEDNTATYCPEDNKLRLYVGRVPRDEYLALKKEGWTSTPKQDCDFVASWEISRENTALSYAGFILDEDQSPTDRAADRAERFSIYREKRREEAHTLADNYESKPDAYGYQSQEKAERAAARRDKLGVKSYNQWEKAEYWQTRTAGVISNALYKLKPSVRMGRIKIIERDITSYEKNIEEYNIKIEAVSKNVERNNFEQLEKIADYFYLQINYEGESKSWYWLKDKITLQEFCNIFLEQNKIILPENNRYLNHLKLRLNYENTMLSAHAGYFEEITPEIGGTIGKYIIFKINKSNKTGRFTTVDILAPLVPGEGWRARHNIKGANYSLLSYNVEKNGLNNYKEPTNETRKIVADIQKVFKEAKPKAPNLINPTPKQAQEILNKILDQNNVNEKFEPLEMTQEEYKKLSDKKRFYSPSCETISLNADGSQTSRSWNSTDKAVFKIRAKYETSNYKSFNRIIILTNKPQKNVKLSKVEKVLV